MRVQSVPVPENPVLGVSGPPRTLVRLRLPAALLMAAITTVAIAWLMRALIEPEFAVLEDPRPSIPLSFYRIPDEPKVPPRDKAVDPPPPVARPPVLPRDRLIGGGFQPLTFDAGSLPGPKLVPAVLLADGDVMSLVQARPVYPEHAKRRGAEGYVVVAFSVLANGSVDDLRVIEASPKGVFDRAALAAVSRSRYRPRVVDGRAVTTTGLRTRLTFTLE